MNAPAAAPKDTFSVLLLAGGLGLAAIAVVKLDALLQDLGERVWNLENHRPAPAKAAGAEYAEELVPEDAVPEETVTRIRPAVKTTRSRTVRTDRGGNAAQEL